MPEVSSAHSVAVLQRILLLWSGMSMSTPSLWKSSITSYPSKKAPYAKAILSFTESHLLTPPFGIVNMVILLRWIPQGPLPKKPVWKHIPSDLSADNIFLGLEEGVSLEDIQTQYPYVTDWHTYSFTNETEKSDLLSHADIVSQASSMNTGDVSDPFLDGTYPCIIPS